MTSTVVKPRRGTFINLLLGWGPTILLNVIMPILTYNYLHNHHHSQVTSLLAASAWTVFELVLFFVLHRRLDEFGVAVLAFFVLSMIAALGFNSARLLLVKDSVLTGAWGIMLLGSLAFPKPLMFYFGRKFATDGTAAGVARWNGLWQYEGFRQAQRFLTAVWGVVFCAEAVLRVILSYNVSTSVMVTVNAVLPLVVIGGLVAWTTAYGRRRQARAAASVMAESAPAGPRAPVRMSAKDKARRRPGHRPPPRRRDSRSADQALTPIPRP
jgi:intracellular septation protein A